MARWRQAAEAAMTDEEIGSLTVLSRSRTEPASRVERAAVAATGSGSDQTENLRTSSRRARIQRRSPAEPVI
jgi:hypothetical protein